MKIGDLVELVNDNWDGFIHRGQRWVPPDMKYPVKGVAYTIRDIGPHLSIQGNGLLLEEIHNSIHPGTNREVCFDVRRFRKLEIPPDLLEQLTEALETELVL